MSTQQQVTTTLESIDRHTRRCATAAATVSLFTLILAVSGCSGDEDGAADANAASPASEPAVVGQIVNVETLLVEAQTFAATVRVTGAVEARYDAIVSAEESGRVVRFVVPKGSPVEAGQPIVELDDAMLRAVVAEAQAAASLASETYERQRRLWVDERVGSELAYLTALHQSERAAASLEVLKTRLRHTTIRAPFAGVFDSNYLEIGEMAAPGAPVIRVISIDQLEVVGGVPERYAGDIRVGTQARVTFDVMPGVVFEEPVSYVGSAIDPGSRTFTVEIPLRSTTAIKPAIVANIELITRSHDNVVAVPQTAVSRTEHGHQIFVVRGSGESTVATARAVQTGPSRDDFVVIERGLEPGERLITLGLVDDGDRVRVIAERTAAELATQIGARR